MLRGLFESQKAMESGLDMNDEYEKLRDSLVNIASELFRFKRVFSKAIGKLEINEQNKYNSQFAWFSKRVTKALEESNLRVISVDGQTYDPGMAVTALNLEDFEPEDALYVVQTMEPIVMENDSIIKSGTVILGRKEI